MTFAPGDRVTASYKTGTYIGEVTEERDAKAAVQVLAVLKHPEQGDLHNPHNPDVMFFHQRRALAYREIALMPIHTLRAYSGEVPDYRESLARSLDTEIEGLTVAVRFAERALLELEQLKKDYKIE